MAEELGDNDEVGACFRERDPRTYTPAQDLNRLLRVTGERGDLVLEQLAVFRVIAELNERDQQLGSLKAYAYPQSLGQWLGTARCSSPARLAGRRTTRFSRSSPKGDHERRIAAQGPRA